MEDIAPVTLSVQPDISGRVTLQYEVAIVIGSTVSGRGELDKSLSVTSFTLIGLAVSVRVSEPILARKVMLELPADFAEILPFAAMPATLVDDEFQLS